IGKGMVDHFVNHHQGIQSKVGKSIDKQRALATDISILKEYLQRFYTLKSRYKLLSKDVWNTDEKRFTIRSGTSRTVLCCTSR
ncbi:hypothetical protein L873DRAFT_1594616, partial [Choiromyces venosus 120613-1]